MRSGEKKNILKSRGQIFNGVTDGSQVNVCLIPNFPFLNNFSSSSIITARLDKEGFKERVGDVPIEGEERIEEGDERWVLEEEGATVLEGVGEGMGVSHN
jgi:hypothetical protein